MDLRKRRTPQRRASLVRREAGQRAALKAFATFIMLTAPFGTLSLPNSPSNGFAMRGKVSQRG